MKKADGDKPLYFGILYADDGGIIGTPEATKKEFGSIHHNYLKI
jgi:hypothetical protein